MSQPKPTATKKRRLDRGDLERMGIPEEFWKVKLMVPADPPKPGDPPLKVPAPPVYLVPASVQAPIENYLLKINEMAEKGAGLILGGGPGVGKTSIAALICKQACSWSHPAFFVSISDLRVMASENVQFEPNSSVMDRCRDVPFLVLDNLKVEDAKNQNFGPYSLEALITHRSTRKRVTLITTRLKINEFKEMFPDVWEAGRSSLVYLPVTGPNLREEAQKQLKAEILNPEGDK